MVEYLALSCSKVSGNVKNIFLQELREWNPLKPTDNLDHLIPNNDQPKKKQKISTQTKITSKFESTTEIDSTKV